MIMTAQVTNQAIAATPRPPPPAAGSDVIVYLAQFGHHSSYGNQTDGANPVSSTTKLNRSLHTLYLNHVNQFPCDVIVFYAADDNPTDELLHGLRGDRPRLNFHQLNGTWWSLLQGLRAQDRMTWRQSGYSIGYRHMIQWYAVRIWPFLKQLGYTHGMRMDDDSYIYSAIWHNMFDHMRQNGKWYAFCQPCMEMNAVEGFFDLIENSLQNLTDKVVDRKNLASYRRNKYLGFYNILFIADMSFLMSPPASTMLQAIDESKQIYEQRTNDLFI